jgi:hypothetical protein
VQFSPTKRANVSKSIEKHIQLTISHIIKRSGQRETSRVSAAKKSSRLFLFWIRKWEPVHRVFMMENALHLLAQLLATDLPGIQTHPKHSHQCTLAISLLEYPSGIFNL